MKTLTPEQYDKIQRRAAGSGWQRKNFKHRSSTQSCTSPRNWPQMACLAYKEFGPWHTIYMKMRRWADNDVWPRVLEALKQNSLSNLILRPYRWTVPALRFIRTAWGR